MVFRQCSVGGRAYTGDPDSSSDSDDDSSSIELKKQKISAYVASLPGSRQATSSNVVLPPKVKDTGYKFQDTILKMDIEAALTEDGAEDADPEKTAHARALYGFFSVLALCHTVVAATDKQTGAIEYRAQSPDESALVQAAADMGFVFLGRDRETLSMRTPSSEEPERYELLNILEFNSSRKRMSVVLKKLDGDDDRLFLLTKGADNVIFDRLKPGAEALKAETERHLSAFANEGLRTLTLAYKVISCKPLPFLIF